MHSPTKDSTPSSVHMEKRSVPDGNAASGSRELSSSPAASHDRSLDIARVVAAFLIVLYHAASAYHLVGGPPIAGYEPWLVVGNLSLWGRVPFFFFLSGYLAARTLAKPGASTGSFVGKRFKALGIPYLFWNSVCLAMLIVSLKRGASFHSESMPTLGSAIAQLTGVGEEPANGPLWFVRDLMLASCLAPLMKKAGPWLLVPCITLILLPEISTDYPRPSSLGYFGIGMLLNYVPKGTFRTLFPKPGLGLFLCFCMGLIHAIWLLPISPFAGVAVGAMGILLAGCYIDKSWPRLAGFISRHANASFLIFVAHVPVFSAARYLYRSMDPQPQPALFFAGLAAVFIVGAVASHHLLKEKFPLILKVVSGGR